MSNTYIHPTAIVESGAEIGEGTKIWAYVQIRKGARVGKNCIISKGVFIDADVKIGDNVKIQNNVSVYHGVTIEDGVFVGPHVCFTNDKLPRGINADGSLKSATDWIVGKILVKYGAALGANSTIVTGTTVGKWAMVGAGSVVTRDVEDNTLVIGNPARPAGKVNPEGEIVERFKGKK